MPIRNQIYRFRALFHSVFVRNIITLVSGTGVAQLIPVIIIPVLTRLFTPAEIGIYASFVAFFQIVSVISCGRYEYAIIISPYQKEADRLTLISTSLASATGLLLFLVLVILAPALSGLFGIPQLSSWSWIILLPVAVAAHGLFLSMTFTLNRNKQYGKIGAGKIIHTGSTGLLQILAGFRAAGFTGLIFGKVAGVVLSVFYVWWHTVDNFRNGFREFSLQRIRQTVYKYRNYPFFNAPHALTTSVSSNLPVILFIAYFSEAIAGFFAMAIRACYMPIQIISIAYGQVLGKRLAEIKNDKLPIWSFVKKNASYLFLIGLIPFGILFAVSPSLFSFVLGEEWVITGEYIRIITPWVFLSFILNPLNYIPMIFNRQRKAFIIEIIYMILRLAAIVTGAMAGSVTLSLTLYTITGVLVLAYQFHWYRQLCKGFDESLASAS